MTEGQTCGQCRHWAKGPADPHNLGAPVAGECRERLQCFVVHDQMGRPAFIAGYAPVPANMPSCSRFIDAAPARDERS